MQNIKIQERKRGLCFPLFSISIYRKKSELGEFGNWKVGRWNLIPLAVVHLQSLFLPMPLLPLPSSQRASALRIGSEREEEIQNKRTMFRVSFRWEVLL